METVEKRLVQESIRATELPSGNVVALLVRGRRSSVMIEFADGIRFFVDDAPEGIELSVT